MSAPPVLRPLVGEPDRAGTKLPTRQRRPGWIALAVTLIVGSAAVGAWLYTTAGAKVSVVVLVGDVPPGRQLARTDLSTVAVAGAVTAVGGDHLDEVVGQYATVHLLPGMLLQRSMVSASSGLAADQAQVGVAVKSGQIPADGLEPGDVVEVVSVPAAGQSAPAAAGTSGGGSPQVLVPRARVSASRDDPAQAGGTLLTLVVPAPQAVAVAAASGQGQVALIRVGAS